MVFSAREHQASPWLDLAERRLRLDRWPQRRGIDSLPLGFLAAKAERLRIASKQPRAMFPDSLLKKREKLLWRHGRLEKFNFHVFNVSQENKLFEK
jgi:hypothetical protein